MQSSSKSTPTRSQRLLQLLLPGIRSQWARVATAISCLFFSVAIRIVEPWPLQYVLDHVIADIRPDVKSLAPQALTQQTTVFGASADTTLILCVLALVCFSVLRAVADYYRTVTFSIVGNGIVTRLRGQVYEHLQSLSLGFHQRSRGGDLTIRLVGDLNMMKDVTVSAALPLLSSILLLIGMVGVMLYMNWRLGMIVLCIFPAFWLVTVRGSRKIHLSAKRQRSQDGALAATAAEALSAVKSVQAMDIGDGFSDAFTTHNTKSNKEGVKTSRLTASLERTVDVMISAATAIVLWKGADAVINRSLTPGELVVYLAYLKRGFKPLQDFAKYTGRLSKAMAASDRVMELLEHQPDVVEDSNALPAPQLQGRLTFEKVTFGYEPGKKIFQGLSFEIPAGQQLAVVGPSGSGKSTLLSLLLRLYDPQSGRILIDGEEIQQWTLRSLRRQISVVLQDNAVFASSVRDNISMAVDQATDEDVIRAASVAMADEFIRQLPEGYDTPLGERGVNLSQGQRQRLAIARAALRQSPILLLDEPTSSLDPENRCKVIAALRLVSNRRTTLLITHDMSLAAECDAVLCISADGTIRHGTHSELLERCDVYRSLCRAAEYSLPHELQSSALETSCR
ncbi:MAG: ABC transporter ATP-binding protein [Planctomyces sp.]|nr:ABC transporter ATP-binding protein [Planctomyces sp.]